MPAQAAVGDTVPVAAEPAHTTGQGGEDTVTLLPTDPRSQPPAPDQVYDELIRAGLSRADGAVALHRLGYGMDTNRWRDRRQALGVGRTSRVSKRSRQE